MLIVVLRVILICTFPFAGSRDGAVVRALASHQCGPGSIPGPGVICGLSLLLVLVLAPRVFSGFSGFPPSTKTNISKFHLESVVEEPLCGGATANSNFFFNFFFSLIHAQCSVFFLIVFKLIGPAEIASAPTSQQAVEGNGATLFCNATCNPQPNITWTKQGNNSVLSSSETLTLTNLRRGDNGTGYICKVQNSLGSDEATTTITVLCE